MPGPIARSREVDRRDVALLKELQVARQRPLQRAEELLPRRRRSRAEAFAADEHDRRGESVGADVANPIAEFCPDRPGAADIEPASTSPESIVSQPVDATSSFPFSLSSESSSDCLNA